MHNKPKTCDDLRSRLITAFRVNTLKAINPGTFLNKYSNLLCIVEQKKIISTDSTKYTTSYFVVTGRTSSALGSSDRKSNGEASWLL